MEDTVKREISAKRDKSFKSIFFRWETLLVLMFVAVNIMNICISKNYLNGNNLFTAICTFIPKGLIAFPMAYLLVLGEIDLSVGSTVALSATTMAVLFNRGVPLETCVALCLIVATACGMLNGLILISFPELFPMIVTLGTQTLYRGIAEMILEDESAGKLHLVQWFYDIYYKKLGPIPICFIVFCVMAVIFGLVLHKTVFGRQLYAAGSNREAARYSGVPVKRNRFICYTLVGLVSGISALFYASWMGSIRSDIAAGYELEAVSMVVLGGISTAGGTGNFPCTVIAIFTIGLLKYGLGLINVNSQTILMIIGAILILVVMAPNIKNMIKARMAVKAQKAEQ